MIFQDPALQLLFEAKKRFVFADLEYKAAINRLDRARAESESASVISADEQSVIATKRELEEATKESRRILAAIPNGEARLREFLEAERAEMDKRGIVPRQNRPVDQWTLADWERLGDTPESEWH